ncbi:MAG: hypothetical protein OES26_24055 [Gammaproteobacteria bacterium]|nr:hypothetical protein [Gammaproteobacteria bacterium]
MLNGEESQIRLNFLLDFMDNRRGGNLLPIRQSAQMTTIANSGLLGVVLKSAALGRVQNEHIDLDPFYLYGEDKL